MCVYTSLNCVISARTFISLEIFVNASRNSPRRSFTPSCKAIKVMPMSPSAKKTVNKCVVAQRIDTSCDCLIRFVSSVGILLEVSDVNRADRDRTVNNYRIWSNSKPQLRPASIVPVRDKPTIVKRTVLRSALLKDIAYMFLFAFSDGWLFVSILFVRHEFSRSESVSMSFQSNVQRWTWPASMPISHSSSVWCM